MKRSTVRAVSDLGPLDKLDEGGQGKVFRLSNRPGVLFKQYLPTVPVDVGRLAALIEAGRSMPTNDRAYLRQRSAMPTELVRDDSGRCAGFLMNAAPEEFWAEVGKNVKLLELQYLAFPPKAKWSSIELLDLEERLVYLQDVARLFDTLHRNELVIGDVSARNLLWKRDPVPSVFLIDCDGIRRVGNNSAIPTVETPDWDDPTIDDQYASVDSDRYKLALVILRVLLQRPKARPEDAVDDPFLERSPVPRQARELLARVSSDGSEPRPTAAEWLSALEGRDRITLPKLPAARRSRVGFIKPAARPVIRLSKRQ
ncbi:hypothetical protein Val02_20840 [Virgisporangium aliadipatigenens]|uniref:Protein kinase domain-containing protein n=1 Tax=Virgisporangium aliadipatigenens TaxID=741659 RepID=A0A8J3YJC4_9ACTN|nr:hypothetical protein [Virgisporangium aliadipatigenens]GIJ45198.1 hypothetical protein Val02_20840 [Virgisporangium aliadipatigenens]